MKIKITTAFRDGCWYSNRIGEIFQVHGIRDFDKCYMVLDNNNTTYIFQKDCIIINEEECYVEIEYIDLLTSERRRINKMDLKNITFTKNGKVIEISQEVKEEFIYYGLSNIDFITGGYYKKNIEEEK